LAKPCVKKITLAKDETFHPETCLVSIEFVSGFIIAEKYTEDRKGETWTKLIEDAIEKLPVEVMRVTSDEGTGLLNHTLKGLDVHHSPDCFHVPYEVGKGTSDVQSLNCFKLNWPSLVSLMCWSFSKVIILPTICAQMGNSRWSRSIKTTKVTDWGRP